jgi:integrase
LGNQVLIRLIFELGLWRAEVAGLKFSDFYESDGDWFAVVKGKEAKTRSVLMSGELRALVVSLEKIPDGSHASGARGSFARSGSPIARSRAPRFTKSIEKIRIESDGGARHTRAGTGSEPTRYQTVLTSARSRSPSR